ncbi:hypothetical protein AGMMS49965_16720 [Bacteroidia bacterium]|nr:hypothetical protein AGMMS49965_16720 [Bacteroidia bacterium]
MRSIFSKKSVNKKCRGIVTDVFYLLRKDEGKDKALAFLHELIGVVDIVAVDKNIVLNYNYF